MLEVMSEKLPGSQICGARRAQTAMLTYLGGCNLPKAGLKHGRLPEAWKHCEGELCLRALQQGLLNHRLQVWELNGSFFLGLGKTGLQLSDLIQITITGM